MLLGRGQLLIAADGGRPKANATGVSGLVPSAGDSSSGEGLKTSPATPLIKNRELLTEPEFSAMTKKARTDPWDSSINNVDCDVVVATSPDWSHPAP
ncbi:unnamed protein product [Linum trigynum]|uniref:Uncharacterized protein n=1 Tax=Linum trigynum TaxID=586398 RepID=A0AAV2G8U7_9ROSI